MNDPWTWTTVWELMMGTRGGVGGKGKGEKLGQLQQNYNKNDLI